MSLSLLATARVESCRVSTGTFASAGAIEVVTATVGDRIDPDGYTATVTDELGRTRTRSIRTNARVRFSSLETLLEYTVELIGVEPNCEIVGTDAVTLFLDERENAEVIFDVVCTQLGT